MYADEDVEERSALPRQPANILDDDDITTDDDEDDDEVVIAAEMMTDELAGKSSEMSTAEQFGAGSLAKFGVDKNASLMRGDTFTSMLSTAASNVSMISAT